MNKIVYIVIGIVIAAGLLGVVLFSGEDEATTSNSNQTTAQTTDTDTDTDTNQELVLNDGESAAESLEARYLDYSEEALAESETENNLIFFHAAWCSVCNSVERNIRAGSIPADVTIFKVNYDSDEGQELAEKYSIPIQYTTVQVDTSGNELTQWVNQSRFGVTDFLDKIEAI